MLSFSESWATSPSVIEEGFVALMRILMLLSLNWREVSYWSNYPNPNQWVISNPFLLLSTQSVPNQSISQSSGIDCSIDLLNISWAGPFLSSLTIIHIAVPTQPLFCISLILSTPNKSFIQYPTNSSKMQTRCLVVKHWCSFMVLE